MTENPRWYALRVAPNAEKAVAQSLRLRGVQEFLPLYTSRRRWSDRTKTLDLPLFPGYVFLRADLDRAPRLVTLPGVRGFVGFTRSPEPIPDAEIDAVQRILDSQRRLQPMKLLREGQRVHIHQGPLAGLSGLLLRIKNADHIVVSLELLQRSVAVTLDGDSVLPYA
jgi:transcription antitermination factor NusG